MPLYATVAEASQAATSCDVLPGVTAAEAMSRMKFLGIPCSAEALMPYQQAHFVPSSTLASSSYMDPSARSQLQSELFPAPPPCPPPPPSHPMVGVMPYQHYPLPQYVSSFGHPDFPLDRSNFLVPAAPNWIGELQAPNSVASMATMGWCPAGPAQTPYVSCSLGQQVHGKNPMMMCNPGQFAQEPVDPGVAWSCPNPSTDFDVIYQRVTDVLNSGGCSLVILINGPALDLSTMTSQLQMMTEDTVLLRANIEADKVDVLSSEVTSDGSTANDLSADLEFKFKQALLVKRRVIVIDHTFAQQMWDVQSYIATAQGQGYHVETVDLNAFGQYAGTEMAGSFMFNEDYQNSVVYPPPPPPPPLQFINGGYSAPMPVTRGLIHDVS